MANRQKFYLTLSEDDCNSLKLRANYLGTSRSNLILLILYLYKDVELSENQIKKGVDCISKEKGKLVSFDMPSGFKDLYKYKPFYLYTLNQYMGAVIHNFLVNSEKWGNELTSNPKTLRINSLSAELVEWLKDFSDKTGISQNLLINYAFMQDWQNLERIYTSDTNSIRKGFTLTRNTLNKLDSFPRFEKADILNNIIFHIRTNLNS